MAVEAADLVGGLIPGLVVERAEVSVRRVSGESPLQQAFVVAIVTAYQNGNGEQRAKTLHRHHLTITRSLGKAIEGLWPTKKSDKIDENFRNLTIVAGDPIQTPFDEIKAAVRGRLADKESSN